MINGERQTWYLGSDTGPVETFYYITQWDPYFRSNVYFVLDTGIQQTTSVSPSGITYTAGYATDLNNTYSGGAAVLRANAQGYYNRGIYANTLNSTTGNTSTFMFSTSISTNGVIYAVGQGNITVGGGEQDDTEIFRLSPSLTTLWQRDIDGITAASGRAMANNNILWAGTGPAAATEQLSFGMMDSNGTNQLAKTVSAGFDVYLNNAVSDSQSNIIVTGYLYNTSDKHFIMKFNSSGTLLWQYYLNNIDNARATVDSSDNIYITAGGTLSTERLGYLIKLNSSGTHQWTREIEVTGWDPLIYDFVDVLGTSISFDAAGDLYMAAGISFFTYTGPPDIIQHAGIFKFDSSGNIIFTNTFDFDPDYSYTQPAYASISNPVFYGNAMVFSLSSQKRFVSGSEKAEFIMSLPINGTLTNSYVIDGNTITYASWGNITSTAANAITTSSGNLSVSTFSGAIGPVFTTIWSNLTPDSDTLFLGNVMPEPPPSPDIQYLAVAGGGGTPARIGGGGGGGGVLTGTYTAVTAGTVITVTVGAGGLGRYGSADPQAGTVGGNTTIVGSGLTTVTAIGGGAGGQVNGLTYIYPDTGGSGGGGSTAENGMSGAGAAGTAGQGYAGGTGYAAPVYGGGGGGGAGAVGGNSPSSGTAAAAGGDGIASSITGSSVYYGGGGGASIYAGGSGTGGAGGLGGGGAGGNTFGSGTNGTANTGGGGGATGGGDFTPGAKGGDGGSGVGILRLLTSQYTGTTTGSPTVTTDGSYTVIKFTSTGTYTA